MVRWRSGSAGSRLRSTDGERRRRSRISRGLSTVVRAAASSIARGRPSSSAHSSSIAARSPVASSIARSRNSCAAGASGPAVPSGASRWTCSPRRPSGTRLVASTPTRGHAESSSTARAAAASASCSQLSSTISASRSARCAHTSAHGSTPGTAAAPTVSAIVAGITSSPVTGARSTSQAPSAQSSADSSATSIATRVLPTPPGPTTVVTRPDVVSAATRARSSSRPTSEVDGRTRLCPSAGRTRGGASMTSMPGPDAVKSSAGPSKSRTRKRPSRSMRPSGTGAPRRSTTSPDSSTWPPCAAETMRAA